MRYGHWLGGMLLILTAGLPAQAQTSATNLIGSGPSSQGVISKPIDTSKTVAPVPSPNRPLSFRSLQKLIPRLLISTPARSVTRTDPAPSNPFRPILPTNAGSAQVLRGTPPPQSNRFLNPIAPFTPR